MNTACPEAPNMRSYETTILVRPGPSREDFDGTLATVRSFYESEGAEFLDFEKWDERKLAYPIQGETHALYVIGYFNADPSAISRIDRRAELSDLVMRQLIVVREGVDLERIRTQRAKAAEAAAEAQAAAALAAANNDE
jgi:small subunit ribosomal protein S6